MIVFTKGEVVWSSHVFEKDQSPENPDEKIPWISSTMLQIPLDPQSKHFKIIKAQSHLQIKGVAAGAAEKKVAEEVC